MILDELARLKRFRRIAKNHGLTLPEESMLPYQEVNYLRGLLNAKVYLEAEPWMCPSWVILSMKDIDTEAEIVSELHNRMYRNWSNIGGVGSKRHGIADSRGLVTPRFDYGSIDFWFLKDDKLLFPALIGKDGPQLKLVSTEDQLYEWKTQIESVEFARLVYHVTKDNSEYVYNEIVLRNQGLEKTTTSFYVVVRPMSPLGVELLESVEYDTSRKMLFVNNSLALMSNKKPTAIIMGEGDDSELPNAVITMSTQQDVKTKSMTGLTTTVLRFDITLSPAGSEKIIFSSPLSMIRKDDKIPTFDPKDLDRDKTIGRWFDFAEERVDAIYPDERIDSAFNQATVSLVTQAFPVMFPEESHLASLSWKERMRVLLALIRSGCNTVSENVVTEIISKGSIPDGPLELTIFSPMLWGLLQYFEHSTDLKIPPGYLEHFRKLTSGVIVGIKKQLGLDEISSEAASIIEDDEPLLHYLVIKEGVFADYEQILWNLAALQAAHRFFVDLHDNKLITTLDEIIPKYQDFTNEKQEAIEGARWLRPNDSSMQHIEREILDVIGSIALLQLSEIEPKFRDMLCDKIAKRRIVGNLWKYFPPRERYSSHLALRLAHYYTSLKKRDLVEPFLHRVLDFFTDDYHLPDFVDIRTYGGSSGAGSSAIAAADFILLLRDMLLFEDGSNFVVLAGVPEEWFTAKKPLVVDSLPTRNGRSRIELGSSSNQYQIEIGFVELPEEFDVHIPARIPMAMIKIYGASIVERASKAASPFLKIIPLSEDTVLTFHK